MDLSMHSDDEEQEEETGRLVQDAAATPASSARQGPKPPPSDRKFNARIIAPIGEDKIMTIGGYSHSLAHLKKIMSQFCRPPVTHESTTISEVKSQQKAHESG
jgi:hypothetical protein